MRYLLATFLLVLANSTVTAQSKAILPYEDKLALRFSPMGLIDIFDENLTAGVGYTLNNRWTVTADLSYIFYSEYVQEKKGVSGYIIKPALRYYLSDKRRFFVEAAPFYKRVGYKINGWLDKDIVNGVPSYQEFKTFTYRKRVVGLNMMAGFQKSLMRNNKLRIELYAGVNIRYKWRDIRNEPRAFYQINDLFDPNVYGTNLFGAGLPHGLRLVYVIR